MTFLGKINTAPAPIEDGDAGIILKADGTFEIFNTRRTLDLENMTELQRSQGAMLLALSMAVRSPAAMALLAQMAVTSICERGAIQH